jgi:hypothetical protein
MEFYRSDLSIKHRLYTEWISLWQYETHSLNTDIAANYENWNRRIVAASPKTHSSFIRPSQAKRISLTLLHVQRKKLHILYQFVKEDIYNAKGDQNV